MSQEDQKPINLADLEIVEPVAEVVNRDESKIRSELSQEMQAMGNFNICVSFNIKKFLISLIAARNVHPAVDIIEHRSDWTHLIEGDKMITYNQNYFISPPQLEFDSPLEWQYFVQDYLTNGNDVNVLRNLIEIAVYALIDENTYKGDLKVAIINLPCIPNVYLPLDLEKINFAINNIKPKLQFIDYIIVYGYA